MKSSLSIVPLEPKRDPIEACIASDCAAEVWTCDAGVILSDTVREEATPRHVTVEVSLMVLTSEPFLVLDVLHYLLQCELVATVKVVIATALRRHALHEGFLLAFNIL